METNSLKKKNSDIDEDRISDLPEPILHHILSLLDMKEVVHTSLLSKKWRYLWISVSNLKFDHRLWQVMKKQNQCFVFHKDRFLDFVDKVLIHRDKSYNIERFCLSSCNSSRIEAWITAAVSQHVQELHLEISDCDGQQQHLQLPDSLFTTAIVRVFKLQSDKKSITVPIQLPNSMCSAAHLKNLELVSAKLPKGDSNRELFFSCPILEILIIKNCNVDHLKVLNISAFRLKCLVLEDNYWDRCKIRICSPNLTSFHCENYTYTDHSLESLSSLVSANISSCMSREMDAQYLIKVLKELYNVETLTLSRWCPQTSSESPDELERLPNPFNNLRHLKLTGWRNSSSMRAIANLLENSPYLETLFMKLESFDYDKKTYKAGDWGSQLSFHCMFDRLKSVEIENLEGCENEFKFLEFLLKNAVVLENVTITTIEASRDSKDLADFSEKLQLLPKASSRVKISFVVKRVTFFFD